MKSQNFSRFSPVVQMIMNVTQSRAAKAEAFASTWMEATDASVDQVINIWCNMGDLSV